MISLVGLTEREQTLLRGLVSVCSEVANGSHLRVRGISRGGSFVTLCIGDSTWISILLRDYNPSVPDLVVPFDNVEQELNKDDGEICFRESRPKNGFSVPKIAKPDFMTKLQGDELFEQLDFLALPLSTKDKKRYQTAEFSEGKCYVTDGFRLHHVVLPNAYETMTLSITRAGFNFITEMARDDEVIHLAASGGDTQLVRMRSGRGDYQVISKVPLEGFYKRCKQFEGAVDRIAVPCRQYISIRTRSLQEILIGFQEEHDQPFNVELTARGKGKRNVLIVTALRNDECLSKKEIKLEIESDTFELAYGVSFNNMYLLDALGSLGEWTLLSFPPFEPGHSSNPTSIEGTIGRSILMPIGKEE